MDGFQIAQVNIGRMLAPLDDPIMAGFVARLAEINALADRSPGFVWRLQTDQGDATYLRPYEDERIIFNMSVWESIETLRHYVFKTAHVELLRNRQAWFEKSGGSYTALWWVPVGHTPDIEDAKERLAYLEAYGPTSFAFTFAMAFEAGSRSMSEEEMDLEDVRLADLRLAEVRAGRRIPIPLEELMKRYGMSDELA